MRTLVTQTLIVLSYASLGATLPSQGSGAMTAVAQSVEEELIARVINAHGGLARIQAVQTLQVSGKLDMRSAGMILPVTITHKRPSMMRMVVSVPSMAMEVVSAYDGEIAWSDNPTLGGLQQLSGEEARDLMEEADIDGLLVDHEAKGYHLEYVGEEVVREANTHKLHLTRSDGSETYLYFDAESYLHIKTEREGTHPMTGAPATMETFLADYRDIEGVMRPFRIETVIAGGTFQTIVVSDMKVDIEVEDAVFAYPQK